MKRIFIIPCLVLFLVSRLFSQSVAINNDGSLPQASAILDIKSNNKGMLVPRMTTAQRTGIASPASGLLVYDTDSNNFWFFNGLIWTQLTAGGSGPWANNGNNISNTNPGRVGIGTTVPQQLLHIQGNALIAGTLNPSTPLVIGGNTSIAGSLTVNNNKGVAYNPSSSTNLKIAPFTTANFHAVLGPFGSAETTIALPTGFTSTPSVFVGSVNGTGGTSGELNRVILVLWGCDTNSCIAKIINTDNVAVDYNITWRCLAVGN